MNFYDIIVEQNKNGIDVYPDFQSAKESDLMVRGKNFYAIWDEEANIWSQDEYDVQRIIDRELYKRKTELENNGNRYVRVKSMKSYKSGSWDKYKNYLSKMPDRFVPLDDKLTFADTVTKKSDYTSKRLGYSLKPADHKAYDEMMDLLYSPSEREKIEWAIGSIVSGDSRKIEKFYVLYGKGGTGKGTVLKIIEKLFKGYDAAFSAQDVCLKSKDFSMESFKTNPLVAIDEDGDLNHIDDPTKLNSIVSHERILMNEKGKPHYPYIPHCALFIASNEPVKIKDQESGLIRRLIDIEPKNKKANPIPGGKYNALMEQIGFELGGIADHCLKVYKKLGRHHFDDYKPLSMMYRTNAFINFVEDSYDVFAEGEGVSLKNAFVMWNTYCDEAGIDDRTRKSYARHKFGDELKNYFEHFDDVTRVNGKQVRSWYSGFKRGYLKGETEERKEAPAKEPEGLKLECTKSLLDELLKDCRAQYEEGIVSWNKVKTTLKDLDTTKIHYILPPEWLLMIDFDLKNEKGEKDASLNLAAAAKWPKTYAEFSKGGAGVHLYYRFSGELDELLSLYAKDIEVKVFHGKAAIRRRLSLCNDEPIATISSGLPAKAKKEKKNTMIDISVVELERYLTNCIRKAMRKEIAGCPSTKSSCDYIKMILDQAYESGKHYDVSRLRDAVYGFAMNSTNNRRYCTDLVRKMMWMSKDPSKPVEGSHNGITAFFDCEVFPNVNMVNWKIAGEDQPVVRLINPTPEDISELIKYDLFGFNNRKYDNHIIHAIRIGYSPEKVYEVSRLITSGQDGYFREAWDYSKSDIYDFSSEKKSLKKFEIDLARQWSIDHPGEKNNPIKHKELGLPWDQPVPEELWPEVAAYCDNDVISTEALFNSPARQADWKARQMLAAITGLSTNATTNTLTTKLIFGDDKHPQTQFNYRNMGTVPDDVETYVIQSEAPDGSPLDVNYTLFDAMNRPIFPGYEYKKIETDESGLPIKKPYWASIYRGEEVGEGGYVYAKQGAYTNVALLDIASMHPSSIIAEQLFGPVYTKVYQDLVETRIDIKHGEYEKAKALFGGKLSQYLDDPEQADALAGALKIAINSVYGLTSAKFDNPFHDQRNKDNIVAKRGALFMVNLKHEVENRGFTVAHIKTDSIKIPNATPEIIRFVMDYGKLYGYNFEHEMTYERMCLVTDADYVAKCATEEQCMNLYGYLPTKQKKHAGQWTETGDRFKDPYTFKTLFTHEPVILEDMFETFSVSTALYLDQNENLSKGDHKYVFVGRCGAFCPVLPGTGGGELVRQNKDKYDSANGAKGYLWKEYEVVRELGLEQEVNREYYDRRAAEAKAKIEEHISFDIFTSNDEIPPWIG